MEFAAEVRDGGAFLSTLVRALEQPGPSGGTSSGPVRYELRGQARADDIRIELVRFPARSRLFVFAPTFCGRLRPDGRRVEGKFRQPRVLWILAAGFFAWLALVPGPAIVSIGASGFPRDRVTDELLPLLGGILAGLAFGAFALRQSRGNRARMVGLLRKAARA